MNFIRAYNYTVAALLVIMHLALPATIYAGSALLEGGDAPVQAHYSATNRAPSDNCPCSEGQGSECCDSLSCPCSCHAPLSHGLQLRYSPLESLLSFMEPSWSLPQVYGSIFVPPQNLL